MQLNITINGEKKNFNIKPADILLDVLRKEGYLGVKRNCEEGTCGSCAVIVNGRAVNSCLLLACQVEGKSVTTIEALGTPADPHLIQEAFVSEGAVQCGYCIPGMIISSKALLDKNLSPSEEDIKRALDGNLCRCTGYVKQIKAVQKAAAVIRGE